MWPWDWISSAGNAISGLGQKAVDWVNSLIASVMSWVTDAVNSIWGAIQGIWRDAIHTWDLLVGYINNLTQTVWDWITHTASQIYEWALRLINDLWHYIYGFYAWALSQVEWLAGQIAKVFRDIYDWVLREIWDPLYRAYTWIKDFVETWIPRIWQYIEHPELLVQLIWAFIVRMWLQYVIRFGLVFTRWLVHNMMGMAGEVFDILENIMANIL